MKTLLQYGSASRNWGPEGKRPYSRRSDCGFSGRLLVADLSQRFLPSLLAAAGSSSTKLIGVSGVMLASPTTCDCASASSRPASVIGRGPTGPEPWSAVVSLPPHWLTALVMSGDT